MLRLPTKNKLEKYPLREIVLILSKNNQCENKLFIFYPDRLFSIALGSLNASKHLFCLFSCIRPKYDATKNLDKIICKESSFKLIKVSNPEILFSWHCAF